jgi:hypothetical protein
MRAKPEGSLIPRFVYFYVINPNRLEYAASQLLVDIKVYYHCHRLPAPTRRPRRIAKANRRSPSADLRRGTSGLNMDQTLMSRPHAMTWTLPTLRIRMQPEIPLVLSPVRYIEVHLMAGNQTDSLVKDANNEAGIPPIPRRQRDFEQGPCLLPQASTSLNTRTPHSKFGLPSFAARCGDSIRPVH